MNFKSAITSLALMWEAEAVKGFNQAVIFSVYQAECLAKHECAIELLKKIESGYEYLYRINAPGEFFGSIGSIVNWNRNTDLKLTLELLDGSLVNVNYGHLVLIEA
jgi:hypothetical protein